MNWIEEIDDILAEIEDGVKGEDGDKITKVREIIQKQRRESGRVEVDVMRKVYLKGKLKGLGEAITSIRNGMGSIKGQKPESLVEEKRKECFAKLRHLNDETA